MAFVLLVGLACAPAGAIEFRSPIDCQLGVDCFIQNYVDQDPSPKWQDFNCGRLTDDGHVLHVVVLDPIGEEVLRTDDRFDEPKVLAFKYVGKRRPIQLWQTGTYRAALTLLRDGKAVFGQTHRLQIAPD